ncbi:MAG TPA: sigma-70 family RNA polymerase sigma factor [Polyangiaceae bacterium]|nr:sigma-70 family RNA polymerase sigma factor [Polyangiaceae bacterium]
MFAVSATPAGAAAVRAGLDSAVRRGMGVAYRLLGDRDAARDACQEAAARALASTDRYDPSRPFYPWYYRILKNHCLDRLSHRSRSVPLRDGDERGGEPVAERRLVEDERARALSRAVEALNQEHREIIELRHFDDLTYVEIAELLGCPEGTVMSRLYRARKRLRTELLSDAAFAGDPR